MEHDRICKNCGVTTDQAALEKCGVCSRYFCRDCAHRAIGGRHFCSAECARGYYFHGEPDDNDEDSRLED